jgi:DNA polymerase bacteriophage-type
MPTSDLRLDWETKSEIDLTKRGPYVYAMHPSTEVLMAAYRIGDGPYLRWAQGEPCPDDIREHIEAGGRVVAFNAAFERLIWWNIMSARYGWPKPPMQSFVCTAVTAAAMSLPRSLERLGDALGLEVKKDKRGKELMKIHSIPVGFDEQGRPIWHEKVNDPESLEAYKVYNDFDVKTEEAAGERLIPLSQDELEVYWMNETVNDRGLRIDVRSARAAIQMIARAKENLNRQMAETTGGYVATVTALPALKKWLAAQGFEFTSMDKDDIDELLHDVDDLPDHVRKALELRQEGAKPSVDKIAAMLARVCEDGRARGVYLHHGAGQTGRFSSRGVQAHNMPKYRKSFEAAMTDGLSLEVLFDNIRTGDPRAVEIMYGAEVGRPLHILADAVRSFIWAAPGHEFVQADYSSIEGRMAAWFAKEQWKVEAYEALDNGTGHGIYELAAAGIYGVQIEDVTKAMRPTGKVAELSCQYQTGVGGIKKFARQAKLKLHTLYPALWETASAEAREFADKRFADRVAHHDPNTEILGREGWIAGEMIKLGWRSKHPMISDKQSGAWTQLEEAAVKAVENPGEVVTTLFGRVQYRVAHGFLWCRLPSGRCLAYGSPKMKELEAPWADKTLPPKQREKKLSLTVRGVDAQTEKWVRFPTYGGSLFNNVVQGSARDILVQGWRNAEKAGYPIVLHTHDEMAAEVPRGFGDIKEFEKLICELPGWADGLPLTAGGWVGKRYRKD